MYIYNNYYFQCPHPQPICMTDQTLLGGAHSSYLEAWGISKRSVGVYVLGMCMHALSCIKA